MSAFELMQLIQNFVAQHKGGLKLELEINFNVCPGSFFSCKTDFVCALHDFYCCFIYRKLITL